jgi:hypothetical protein
MSRASTRASFRAQHVTSVGLLCAAAFLPACDGGSTSQGSGAVKVQISGEELATDGIRFPEGSEVVIGDGWEIDFSHVLVSIGRVWLSENPDRAPADQSQTGDVVAEMAGPWIVDLHQEGSEPGAGGEGTAIPIGTFEKQNKNGDAPLAAGEVYAFSFETVAAGEGAELVNLGDDADAQALVQHMVDKGYSVLYAGTATFKGKDCQVSSPDYDFTKLPPVVTFRLGFATPSSSLNCQNQENQGEPFQGEEYRRGVTIKDGAESLAQMTFHLDHPFYSAVTHEPRLYFDQLAAQLVGRPEGTELTADLLAGVDPTAFTDAEGATLPFRECDGFPVKGSAERYFETGTLGVDPGASPSKSLRDYRDFVHYVQSTQGHMNGGEGICFTKRNYPSPP